MTKYVKHARDWTEEKAEKLPNKDEAKRYADDAKSWAQDKAKNIPSKD